MLTTNGRAAGVSGVMALLSGAALGYPFLIATGLTMLLGLCLGLLFVLWRPSLSARQQVTPVVVGVGEVASANIEVLNTGRRRSGPVVAANQVAGRVIDVALPAIEAGERFLGAVPIATSHRGAFDVGPLTIERVDPLGLFRATTHRGSAANLVVHPRVHQMSPLPTGHRREFEGSAAEQPHEGGISFHSLRDYVLGDDLRLIHWRSVAKTGSLMVRKNIITSEPRLMILLDTWSGSYQGDQFEEAASVAASLVQAGCNSHYPVQFATSSGLHADANASGDGKGAIMRILATIEPSADDPGLNGVVRFTDRTEGVSLGAITGQPPAERTVGISRARGSFDMITVVQVGETFDRPPMSIPGALVVNGADAEDVVAHWKARFG